MDAERAKFAGWHVYMFFTDDVVMLIYSQFAGLSVEIPASAFLKRSCDHRLRRIKLHQLAVQINPRQANNALFIYGEKVRVGNHAGSVHFELEKILPIDVLRSIDTIQHWQANLAIGVKFGVRKIQALADFFGHVVSPT